MPEYKTPGVYIEEIPSGVKQIKAVSTCTTVFIGYSPKGPTKQARQVSNWSEFEKSYGPLSDDFLLGQAVFNFFKNGGQTAIIIRLNLDIKPGSDYFTLPNSNEFCETLFPPNKSGGVYLLEQVGLYNLVNVPGLTNTKELNLLLRLCTKRNAFLIVDSPQTATFDSLEFGPDNNIRGENSAFYFPWINVTGSSGKNIVSIPPGGFVAGIYAHTDAVRGVWKAPAGIAADLEGALAPSFLINDDQNMVLNPLGINCIREYPTFGTILWGARTLSSDPEWTYVPVRRLFLFIEESIKRSIQWAVFEPNDEPLWASIRASMNEFFLSLYKQGAFAGTKPEECFYVKCGRDTTTLADIKAGRFNIEIGFAPMKPAEFVILKIQQKASV